MHGRHRTSGILMYRMDKTRWTVMIIQLSTWKTVSPIHLNT